MDAVVGPYQLVRPLAPGTLGEVFEGWDPAGQRAVAVKLLGPHLATDAAARRSFLEEARAASQVRHANLVDILDFGATGDGQMYLTLELCAGSPLGALLASGPVPLFRALGIVGQLVRALGAAHERGLLHRDLEPRHILVEARRGRREIVRVVGRGAQRSLVLDTEDEFDFVKLLGIGMARLRDRPPPSEAPALLPHYRAPEQLRGEPADQRADVYAVGVLFFHLLTGRPPFVGADASAIAEQHLGAPPPLPRLVRPEIPIPEAAECVIVRALAKVPERRHQSMLELHNDLQTCFQDTFFRRDADLLPGAKDQGIT